MSTSRIQRRSAEANQKCAACRAPVLTAYEDERAVVCDRQQSLEGDIELHRDEVRGCLVVRRLGAGEALYHEHACISKRATEDSVQQRQQDVDRALAYVDQLLNRNRSYTRGSCAHRVVVLAAEVRRLRGNES